MHIAIPYGKTQLDLYLPAESDVTVLRPHDAEADPNPLGAVHRAIESVDWGRYAGARTAAIAINDKTRPVPNHLLLPPLLEKLELLGVAPDRITLIVATGSHTPMLPAEFPAILPQEIIKNYRVVSHNVDNEDNIVRLGMTKAGTIVSINRTFFEANLRLVVGNVEPHQFVGFSGGVKTAVIGLAGWDTINRNHRMMTHQDASLGNYDTNPVRQDIEDLGRVVNVHLALNTVMNGRREIVRVFCGPPLNVMRMALPVVREVYTVPVEKPFDIMVVSPGGHPKDINIYQAQKALGHASLVVREGGTIVIAAACPEGSGSDKYEHWVRSVTVEPGHNPHQAVIERFKAEGFNVGPHKAYQIARDSVNRRVIWVSDLPHPEHFLMETAPTLAEAVSAALSGCDRPRIGVLPYANSTIPLLTTTT